LILDASVVPLSIIFHAGDSSPGKYPCRIILRSSSNASGSGKGIVIIFDLLSK